MWLDGMTCRAPPTVSVRGASQERVIVGVVLFGRWVAASPIAASLIAVRTADVGQNPRAMTT
jgi:hypothetical protein